MLEIGANTITRQRIVLVEGTDEAICWEALLSFFGRDDIQVLPYQGKSNLANYLPALRNQSQFEQVEWLAICQDADLDPVAAFQRIQGALNRLELPVPARSWTTTPGIPEVVAMVMPDGIRLGDWETLVWGAIADQTVAPCVDEYLECLDRVEPGTPRLPSKARTYAYLAVQHPPGKRLGEAMRAGFFDFGHSAFRPILDLLPTK